MVSLKEGDFMKNEVLLSKTHYNSNTKKGEDCPHLNKDYLTVDILKKLVTFKINVFMLYLRAKYSLENHFLLYP